MALKEQFGATPAEQVNVMLGRLNEETDTERRVLCVLEMTQQYASLLAEDLTVAYIDPEDPDIGITAWDAAWGKVEKTLTDFFFDSKLQLLTEVDAIVRDTVPGVDPLGFPIGHEDPSISTFYSRFEKNLPKPISKDTHIGRRADWGY